MPALMISYSPARYSRSGSVSSTAGIDQHGQRLMKAADQVLAADQVDAGLAADGRVHLRQQRGGDLQDRDAAHEDRGEESGHVVDDAAAERDDDAGAVGAAGTISSASASTGARRFWSSPPGRNKVSCGPPQSGATLPLMTPDILGRDDENFAGFGGKIFGDASENAALDDGAIGLMRRLDFERRHIQLGYAEQEVGCGSGASRFPRVFVSTHQMVNRAVEEMGNTELQLFSAV